VTRTISIIAAGIAAVALTAAPALAEKLTKVDGKNIAAGGKAYEVSGSRTKVTIGGKASTRDSLKVGMDCDIKGPAGGEATSVACK
jgi:hypothetical protein